MIPFPEKKYDIIYADPAWEYGGSKNGKHYSALAPEKHYPCLSVKQLSVMPVQDIVADDCLLFMWSPSSHLEGVITVGNNWGFNFITVAFVWDKQRLVPSFYTLSQIEMCLVFKKGKIPRPRGSRNVRQFLSVKRREHSQKPDEVRDRIVEMFPAQSKIELFARERFEGWDAWGNEV